MTILAVCGGGVSSLFVKQKGKRINNMLGVGAPWLCTAVGRGMLVSREVVVSRTERLKISI